MHRSMTVAALAALQISLVIPISGAGPHGTTLYFLRHADDQVHLVQTGPGVFQPNSCFEVLNPLGLERAARLADWFVRRHITEKLDLVVATHKIRTLQTVSKIAQDAGLSGNVDQYDDQNDHDGVAQVPPTPQECDAGFVSSSSSLAAMTTFLHMLSLGTTAVVAAHSTTIYPIMRSFGIDTSDPTVFPQDSNGKVVGFDNLWIVSIDAGNVGVVREHVLLDFRLQETARDRLDGEEDGRH